MVLQAAILYTSHANFIWHLISSALADTVVEGSRMTLKKSYLGRIFLTDLPDSDCECRVNFWQNLALSEIDDFSSQNTITFTLGNSE